MIYQCEVCLERYETLNPKRTTVCADCRQHISLTICELESELVKGPVYDYIESKKRD